MEIGVYEKSIDSQGRVVIPAALRDKFKHFLLFVYGDYLKIVPKKRVKLTELFDSIEADVDTLDMKELKRRAYAKKYPGLL